MGYSISKDFKFSSLLYFAMPSVIMMIFSSLYAIVDGVFVSRYVGSDALSASNIVFPIITIIIAVAVMLGTGGSAVIARRMGEGKIDSARQGFTFIVMTGIVFGIVVMIVGLVWLKPIVILLGATERLLRDGMIYIGILLVFGPLYVLQLIFQVFFVTEGKPDLGLAVTVVGGISNVVFDYLFMGPMNMGIAGAAIATGIGQAIPAIAGLIYFSLHRKNLYFVKFKIDFGLLKESCFNGSSEMVSNLATSVVTFLFNIIMLKLRGEDGVAAITIALYGQFLFNSLYLGYSMGVAPVISFNYGRKNTRLLKRIVKICLIFMTVSSVSITALSLIGNDLVVGVFVPPGSHTFEIASNGCFLFAFNFLFSGINIFTSSMFTALSNGKISAMVSFLRTFVFLVLSILSMPYIIGEAGVWLSVPIAEAITSIVSISMIVKHKKMYNY